MPAVATLNKIITNGLINYHSLPYLSLPFLKLDPVASF